MTDDSAGSCLCEKPNKASADNELQTQEVAGLRQVCKTPYTYVMDIALNASVFSTDEKCVSMFRFPKIGCTFSGGPNNEQCILGLIL